jgi:hypothetical protein
MVQHAALKVALVLCVTHAGACLAANQKHITPEQKPLRKEKTVVSGRKTKIDNYFSIQSDCSPNGYPEVRVSVRPQHGEATTEQATKAAAYPAGNPRSRCNGRQLPATALFYTSASAYAGKDHFEVDVIFPTGGYRRAVYEVTVR